jgi:hypothetical protein
MFVGDTLAQWAPSGQQHHHDFVRSGTVVAFSAGAFVPVNYLWYNYVLERVIPSRLCTGLSVRSAAWVSTKSVLGVSTGLLLNPLFFAWTTTVETLVRAAWSSSGGTTGLFRENFESKCAQINRAAARPARGAAELLLTLGASKRPELLCHPATVSSVGDCVLLYCVELLPQYYAAFGCEWWHEWRLMFTISIEQA